jgi:hypothetical protein
MGAPFKENGRSCRIGRYKTNSGVRENWMGWAEQFFLWLDQAALRSKARRGYRLLIRAFHHRSPGNAQGLGEAAAPIFGIAFDFVQKSQGHGGGGPLAAFPGRKRHQGHSQKGCECALAAAEVPADGLDIPGRAFFQDIREGEVADSKLPAILDSAIGVAKRGDDFVAHIA